MAINVLLIRDVDPNMNEYLAIRRKELKRHAINTKKNMILWKILDILFPSSKPLMEKLYWHP